VGALRQQQDRSRLCKRTLTFCKVVAAVNDEKRREITWCACSVSKIEKDGKEEIILQIVGKHAGYEGEIAELDDGRRIHDAYEKSKEKRNGVRAG